MEDTFEPLDREKTLQAVKKCFETGTSSTFLETMKSRLEDPTVPMVEVDNKGETITMKRTYHPLLWTVAIAFIAALAIVLFFSFKS
jgi:hypothetical protein